MRRLTRHHAVRLGLALAASALLSGCVATKVVFLHNATGAPIMFYDDRTGQAQEIPPTAGQPVPYQPGAGFTLGFASGRELWYEAAAVEALVPARDYARGKKWLVRSMQRLDLQVLPQGSVAYLPPLRRMVTVMPAGFPLTGKVTIEDPESFRLPAAATRQLQQQLLSLLEAAHQCPQPLLEALAGSPEEKRVHVEAVFAGVTRLLQEDQVIFTNPQFPNQAQTWHGRIVIHASCTWPALPVAGADRTRRAGQLTAGDFVFDLEQTFTSLVHEGYHLLRRLPDATRNEEWEAELAGHRLFLCLRLARPDCVTSVPAAPEAARIHEAYSDKSYNRTYPAWFPPLPPPPAAR